MTDAESRELRRWAARAAKKAKLVGPHPYAIRAQALGLLPRQRYGGGSPTPVTWSAPARPGVARALLAGTVAGVAAFFVSKWAMERYRRKASAKVQGDDYLYGTDILAA